MDINPPYTLYPSSIDFHAWGKKNKVLLLVCIFPSSFHCFSFELTPNHFRLSMKSKQAFLPTLSPTFKATSSPPVCSLSTHPSQIFLFNTPPAAPPLPSASLSARQAANAGSAGLISPLRVPARVFRSHVGVRVCERVCPSKACQGNGPRVHRLRAVDTVPHRNCEAQLWQVAGGRGAEGGEEQRPVPSVAVAWRECGFEPSCAPSKGGTSYFS